MAANLARQVILNTRPAHQQAALKDLLEADGASVLAFPVIEIVPVEPTPFHQSLARDLHDYDILLFVSRNSVDGAFRFFAAEDLPESVQLGVIGSASESALAEIVGSRGVPLVADEPYNSEALLAAAGLQQVANKRVLIFRGQAGRNLLGDELTERGAECRVLRSLPA